MSHKNQTFECSIYDLLNPFGFLEGEMLIPEEEPLVKQACEYVVTQLGIIDQRWQPIICYKTHPYVIFDDLKTQETLDFYDMKEIDRRKIEAILDDKDLYRISINNAVIQTKQPEKSMSLTNPTLEDVWKLFQETDRQMKETDRQMKETDRQMKETDRQMKETDKRIDKLVQDAEISRKEIDKALKELGKQIGGVGKKIGSFTEGLALPSMTKILTQKFGMTHISPSTRVKDKQGNEHEIDVLAYANGEINTAFIVEVKSHLREDGIEQILKQLANFPILFPELADKKLYGILAAVDANQHLQNQVLKKGLYFAKIHDDQFSLCVPENFKPLCFNP